MLTSDPLCYKTAIFYEVVVRGFHDSDNNGTGDIRGICERLDYLEWLGVDCIWLLPFYQSPLRDGGYDISDFYSVLPEYGTASRRKPSSPRSSQKRSASSIASRTAGLS